MMYEIVMPQLSDSMDEGKLISWKVSVDQAVKSGDVIAEVESDKAVMEVQTFKDGVIKELLAKEGDTVKIGTVIARITTDSTKETQVVQKDQQQKREEKEEKTVTDNSEAKKEEMTRSKEPSHESIFEDIFHIDTTQKRESKVDHSKQKSSKAISPKARAKAAAFGFNIDDIVQNSKNEVVHSNDVDNYLVEKYFTPKAQKLLKEYQLDFSLFSLDHKIDETELREYINKHEIALPKSLTAMQKAIISNVTASAKKPVFHIYESVDAALLEEHKQKSITVWLIKIVAKVMMQHDSFRSKLLDDAVSIMPNASISIAVADKKDLYMPVVKDANSLSVDAIQQSLDTFKTKLQARSFTQSDMQGSTFGISNLGMLGVERFDAMINKDDSAMMAVGAVKDGKISLTLTVDHRLINGYEAALFMQDLKKELQNSINFKTNI